MSLATFKSLCIDVRDLELMGPWWAERLGWRLENTDHGPSRGAVIRGQNPGEEVWLCVVPEAKSVKNRVHLDLRTHSGDLFSDSPRLSAPDLFPWVVHADPEGNEFCVFTYDDPDVTTGLKDIVVDATDAEWAAEWWAGVLGGEWDEDEGEAWIDDVPGAPVDSIDFVGVPEPKTVKNRVHWDVRLNPGVGVDDLVRRGASVVSEQPDWTVMADPQGNEFCVFPRCEPRPDARQ